MILLFNIDKLVEGQRECKGSVQPRKSLRHQCLKGRQKMCPRHCSSTCPTISEVIKYFIFPFLSPWFMIFLCFDRITSAPGSRRYFNLFPVAAMKFYHLFLFWWTADMKQKCCGEEKLWWGEVKPLSQGAPEECTRIVRLSTFSADLPQNFVIKLIYFKCIFTLKFLVHINVFTCRQWDFL